jgi:biopolymer transport protein ExbD
MRFNMILLILIAFLCVTAAFAEETVVVDIPFGFESQGQYFPPSQYEVRLSNDHEHLLLAANQTPARTTLLLVRPTAVDQYAAPLSIKFDDTRGIHSLKSIRLGAYEYHH